MEKSCCILNSTYREVLEAINAAPAGISFILNDADQLIGVFTDGDMRRLLIRGEKKLDDTIEQSDLSDFVSAEVGENMDSLMARTSKKVRIIPIVDSAGRLVDYFRYEHKTNFTPVAEPSLGSKELEYLTDAFTSTWISSKGKYIDRFEAEFSEYCGVNHGVATSNGTVAIHLALVALGIGEGDEVIVPDLTFAATINAVLYTGATPVIVDVDFDRWTISPGAIEEALTPKTKAIIPVHVYGQACEMDRIMSIAKAHNLFVVEDCAEAHGAEFNGKRVGSFGDVSTFSFFANKIITTGEGGMCVTSNEALDAKMRVLRDHGMSPTKRYWHDQIGFNYRMTNLQAAIGCAQLERIDEILADRFELEQHYKAAFKELEIEWQKDFPNSKRVIWLICALVKEGRDELIQDLRNHKIDSRPFFYPLSEMPVYRQYTKSNTNSLQLSRMGINLPSVSGVDFEMLSKVYSRFILK